VQEAMNLRLLRTRGGGCAMSDKERMDEIRDLIAFYDKRGANWLLAAEYTLGLRSGELDRRRHWLTDYIHIPIRRRKP